MVGQQAIEKPGNDARTAFILGLIAVFGPFILGIPAWRLGADELSKIAGRASPAPGPTQARAGLGLGLVATLLMVALTFLAIAGMILDWPIVPRIVHGTVDAVKNAFKEPLKV